MTSPDRDITMDLNVQFEFTGEVWPWRGPAPYDFVTVPHEVSPELRAVSSLVSYGGGVIPAGARIGERAARSATRRDNANTTSRACIAQA